MPHPEPQNLCAVYTLLFGLVCLIVGGWAASRPAQPKPPDPPSEG